MTSVNERLVFSGVQELSTLELLSLALGDAMLEGDPISEQLTLLMQGYPTVHELCKTDVGYLISEYGLGENLATQLCALLEVARRLTIPQNTTRYQITTASDAAKLVIPDLGHLDHEEMRILLLDQKNHVVGNQRLYQGTVGEISARMAEVFHQAITRKCAGIILCHNHPTDSLDPSPEDIAFTKLCVAAGQLLDIEVVDHLIIGAQHFLSLKDLLRWSK